MPDPGDVYMEELSTLFRGRAILNPRRTRLRSGRGLRSPIDVGDVVYDYEGQLTRLFNCLKSPGDQDEESILPDNFEVLAITSPYSTRENHEVAMPITVDERLVHAGPYFSRGVRRIEAQLGASVASTAGASIAFSTLRKQGAVLLTSGNIRTRVSPNRPAFEQYMMKHFDDWCSLLASRQLDVRPQDLIFVTAADYTSTWSNLVYTEHQLQGSFSVEIPSVSTVGGQLSVKLDVRHAQSETRDWGPNPEDLEIARRCASPSDQPASLHDDQVIFLRGLRGKKKVLFKGFHRLVGEAEPTDLDEDPPDCEGGSELVVEDIGGSSREDFLEPVLDYILENSNADMAIAHYDDYNLFLDYMQSPESIPFADWIQLVSAEDGPVYGTIKDGSLRSETFVDAAATESSAAPEKTATPVHPDMIITVGESKAKLDMQDAQVAGLRPDTVGLQRMSSAESSSESHSTKEHTSGRRRSFWQWTAERRRRLKTEERVSDARIRRMERPLSPDPLDAMLQPPADETPAERTRRTMAEQHAKQVSDSIDKQLKREYDERKRDKVDVKVLLVGQSESGKSTTMKQFQIAYSPASFREEQMVWRPVIYLNIVRSICLILDALLPDLDEPEDVPRTASVAQPSAGATISDVELKQKHEWYSSCLRPIYDLEERLIDMLVEDGEVEASRLGDGSTPGWSDVSTFGKDKPLVKARRRVATDWGSHRARSEVTVRTTFNWKKAISASRVRSHPVTPGRWWEDPSDPVHVLSQCSRDMVALWTDPVVRLRLTAQQIELEETSGFYLNELDRITALEYIPTEDDVLKARLKTTGVVEHTFAVSTSPKAMKSMVWKIFDVGGARIQRQAWAPYFMDMNAIIFLAPLSAFNQVLAEDPRVNRLEDSLLLWRSIVSNKLLRDVNLILFLNKCDLLKAKLEHGVRLSDYLLTYGDRPNDYESVSRYLRNKFGLLHQQYTPNPSRELFIHFTAVTDTRRSATIINNVREIIVRQHLKGTNLTV